jgi:hypothetical protein
MKVPFLRAVWVALFYRAPHDEILELFCRYASRGPVETEHLLSGLISSGAEVHVSEEGRSIWLGASIGRVMALDKLNAITLKAA